MREAIARQKIRAMTEQAIGNGLEPAAAEAERDLALDALAHTAPGEVWRLFRDGAYAPQPTVRRRSMMSVHRKTRFTP
jgi:hypothetical protein